MADMIVFALSAADIPVVIPEEASIETVKFVPSLPWLSSTIRGSLSLLALSSVNVKQIRPLPYLAIKLMNSGVI